LKVTAAVLTIIALCMPHSQQSDPDSVTQQFRTLTTHITSLLNALGSAAVHNRL